MYSSLKKTAGFTIFLAILHFAAAVVCTLYLDSMDGLTPSMLIAFNAFLYTGAVALLIIGFYLWNLYSDLAAHEDSNYNDISSLRHRVEVLEKAKQ